MLRERQQFGSLRFVVASQRHTKAGASRGKQSVLKCGYTAAGGSKTRVLKCSASCGAFACFAIIAEVTSRINLQGCEHLSHRQCSRQ